MIYLIGGPPRCGKTTLAKAMFKQRAIPWISCDMLQTVVCEYMTQKQWNELHPYSLLRKKLKTNDEFSAKLSAQKIVSVLRRQARPVFPASIQRRYEFVPPVVSIDGWDFLFSQINHHRQLACV